MGIIREIHEEEIDKLEAKNKKLKKEVKELKQENKMMLKDLEVATATLNHYRSQLLQQLKVKK